MAMKHLLSVQLNAAQIREACAIAVRDRVSAELMNEDFTVTGLLDGAEVTVHVSKKRVRRAKKESA